MYNFEKQISSVVQNGLIMIANYLFVHLIEEDKGQATLKFGQNKVLNFPPHCHSIAAVKVSEKFWANFRQAFLTQLFQNRES